MWQIKTAGRKAGSERKPYATERIDLSLLSSDDSDTAYAEEIKKSWEQTISTLILCPHCPSSESDENESEGLGSTDFSSVEGQRVTAEMLIKTDSEISGEALACRSIGEQLIRPASSERVTLLTLDTALAVSCSTIPNGQGHESAILSDPPSDPPPRGDEGAEDVEVKPLLNNLNLELTGKVEDGPGRNSSQLLDCLQTAEYIRLDQQPGNLSTFQLASTTLNERVSVAESDSLNICLDNECGNAKIESLNKYLHLNVDLKQSPEEDRTEKSVKPSLLEEYRQLQERLKIVERSIGIGFNNPEDANSLALVTKVHINNCETETKIKRRTELLDRAIERDAVLQNVPTSDTVFSICKPSR